MISIVSKLLGFLKSPVTKVVLIVLGIFAFLSYILYQNKLIDKLNSELEITSGNYNAYVNLYNGEVSANNLLRLNESELKRSKDSLLTELGYYIEENRKLKKIKEPEIVSGVVQYIYDSIYIEVPVVLPEFHVIKELNEETIIEVHGVDTLLTVIPEISNTIKLEIGVNRVYKNSYKNGWVRFWHFDWKKVDSYEYSVDQSNDLINLKDVKIIKIED